MAGDDRTSGEIFVIGADQRSASLAIRDRLFVEDEAHTPLLQRLQAAGLGEGLLLATCDRIEIIGVAADPAAGRAVLAVLAESAGLSIADLAPQTYQLTGVDAIRHVFLVAASLRSTVVGEPHILAQIKAALAAARNAGLSGPGLEALAQSALATGKRVQSETQIGRRPVSAAAAAVERARSIHGDLGQCTALLLGAGEMGERIAQGLREAGLVRFGVTHPRNRRAEQAAGDLSAHLVPFAELATALVQADILVATLGSRQPVVSFDMMRQVLKARRKRPVLIVDVAVPGDIDPGVDRLEQAFLYTFDDLERVAENGRQSRETAAADAHRLVEAAVADYIRDRSERSAVPTLTLLRERFEAARMAVLAEAGDDAEKATRLLVNRLLHHPTLALRRLVATAPDSAGSRQQLEALLRQLFDPAADD
jgi:glutamyl-tRNA reductase